MDFRGEGQAKIPAVYAPGAVKVPKASPGVPGRLPMTDNSGNSGMGNGFSRIGMGS
jgi:hypothetical protein